MRDATIAVEDVSHAFGTGRAKVQALDNVTIDFNPGEFTLVEGPSGSGKTTLLSIMGCLLTPDKGSVQLMDREVSRVPEAQRTMLRREYIGFIFQAFRLFRALSALENIVLALEIAGIRGSKANESAMNALEAVGIPDRSSRRPHELSGGEKQRVAIARALVTDPPILLADEPTASLDTDSGLQVARILHGLAANEGRMIIGVTHDARLERFAHRIIKLQDGRVIDDRKANS